ncbi:MAG: hypothetical protein ABI782_03540 [Anaerolineaceae bacterium]
MPILGDLFINQRGSAREGVESDARAVRGQQEQGDAHLDWLETRVEQQRKEVEKMRWFRYK